MDVLLFALYTVMCVQTSVSKFLVHGVMLLCHVLMFLLLETLHVSSVGDTLVGWFVINGEFL
jgi:hypothetical protein